MTALTNRLKRAARVATDPVTNPQRRNQWLVGVGVVILLASVVGNVVQSYEDHQSSVQYQRELVAQDHQILALTQQTKASAQRAALALLWAEAIDADLTAICHASGATSCAQFPNFSTLMPPSPSAAPTAPTASSPTRPIPNVVVPTITATTTAPKHGKSHKH